MRNIATTLFITVLLCLFATTASAKDKHHATAAKGHKSVAHKHQPAATKTSQHNKKSAHKSPSAKKKSKAESRASHHKVSLHKAQPETTRKHHSANADKTLSSPPPQTKAVETSSDKLAMPDLGKSAPPATGPAVPSPAAPNTSNQGQSSKPETASTEESSGLMDAMKKRAEPLLVAMGLLGTPYKIGGANPDKGVDCSGLVHYVYKQAANLDLPHSAKALSQNGAPVKKDDLQPGDLVFFHTLRKRFSHVGIYAGDGKFVHADSKQVKEVMVSSLDSQYWAKHFDGARRLQLDSSQAK